MWELWQTLQAQQDHQAWLQAQKTPIAEAVEQACAPVEDVPLIGVQETYE